MLFCSESSLVQLFYTKGSSSQFPSKESPKGEAQDLNLEPGIYLAADTR